MHIGPFELFFVFHGIRLTTTVGENQQERVNRFLRGYSSRIGVVKIFVLEVSLVVCEVLRTKHHAHRF